MKLHRDFFVRSFSALAGCLMVPMAAASPPASTVGGLISTDTTWHTTHSPYTVTGSVTVAAGATLSIEPGVTVGFKPNTALRVEGRLLAEGTETQRISFTRADAGTRWRRILFVAAQPSVLRHCIVEFADCVGDHKVNYPTNCSPMLYGPKTNYQAVVALGCHLDIEGCIFRNLPDTSASAEGDAISIVSDDPSAPGEASANIRDCQFLGIGQGIHTRYAFVLIEDCYFTGHNGDNDDVDLYGESNPPPLVRNNVFLNSHDDFINPTRCSAWIVGNLFGGSSDGGVVLRDVCSPVVMNNVIYGCPSSGISSQNGCTALLVNNTIFSCGQGINFRDHNDRRVPPYCLAPTSGKATVTNCIIWKCTRLMVLEDPGSHVAIDHCDLSGAQSSVTVPSGSTMVWGPGNVNLNPQFASITASNFHLTATSPCLDAGIAIHASVTLTNLSGIVTSLQVTVTADHDGVPRPLDSNGDGTARHDMGAYEFLLSTADSNGDGIPDGWCFQHELDPTDPAVAAGNPDGDAHTTGEEWVADTDPTDPASWFRIASVAAGETATVAFLSSSNRQYTLLCSTNVFEGQPLAEWHAVEGQQNKNGSGSLDTLSDTNTAPHKLYRVQVSNP